MGELLHEKQTRALKHLSVHVRARHVDGGGHGDIADRIEAFADAESSISSGSDSESDIAVASSAVSVETAVPMAPLAAAGALVNTDADAASTPTSGTRTLRSCRATQQCWPTRPL